MKHFFFSFVLLFITLLGASQSIFLQVSGLQGDATEGQPVFAYSFGVSNSAVVSGGGGMSAGKANFQDLHVTMQTGKMSTALFTAVATGLHIAKVELKVFDQSRKLTLLFTLEDVLITSYQQGAACATANCDKPTENVSMMYGKIKIDDLSNGKSAQANPNSGN